MLVKVVTDYVLCALVKVVGPLFTLYKEHVYANPAPASTLLGYESTKFIFK